MRLSNTRRVGWKQIPHLHHATTSNPDRWRAGPTSLNYSARWGDFLLWMQSGILADTFLFPRLWCLHNILRLWQPGRGDLAAVHSRCQSGLTHVNGSVYALIHADTHTQTHGERGQQVSRWSVSVMHGRSVTSSTGVGVTPVPRISRG